ncbi:hypothetical protein [Methanobrevibacter sp.]|uniref:hypothetical protein n=1 Tax=Methanobrevibacter sp. TaxID=66852 RepID=UPI00388DBD96
MDNRKLILIFGIFLIFISVASVYTADSSLKSVNSNYLPEGLDENDLTGCCSIAYQLEGNNSTFAFRRDAGYSANILIEEIDWHGKPAVKQYKTDGEYFCQVIVTNDGWIIGFGGLDDGDNNKRIEEITADMVLNNTIDNSTLQQIQDIKNPYGRGHALIKAPDGRYGVAMATTHYTGHLNPGEYISIPNKPEYSRSGNISLNNTNHVGEMHQLETTDAYGVVRRDVTVFDYHQIDNGTFKGNLINITASNDNGSVYNIRNNVHDTDDIHFNGTVIEGSKLPMAPKFMNIGTVMYSGNQGDNNWGFGLNLVFYLILVAIIIILFVIIIRMINRIRNNRRRKKYNQYYNDRYRYR